jgi:hypothetical protein
MTGHPLERLMVYWLPILIIYAIWVIGYRLSLKKQRQVIELLTEIRDRLPPAPRA